MIQQEVEGGTMMLLPPAAHLCQTCGSAHEPEMPHNAHSMYYQVAFNMEHDRAPNWIDAMEHCSDEVKAAWTEGLTERGIDVAGGALYPARG